MSLARIRYDKFAGVDFSTDAAKVDPNRACSAKNFIADSGGYPEKRVGYRVLCNFGARINGVFKLGDKYIVHAGENAYIWDGISSEAPSPALSELNDAKSFGIEFRKKLYILTGKQFLVFDGEKLSHVHDVAFAPLVATGMEKVLDPYTSSYTYENGTPYQPLNLLSGKRRVGIKLSNTKTKEIKFHCRAVEGSLKLYGPDGTEISQEGNYTPSYSKSNDIVSGFYIDLVKPVWNEAGGDDYIIEYEAVGERIDKNRAIIEECTFATVYENRLFLSGNPNYPSCDFYSELNDPTYFTDIAYTKIGTADEAPDEDEEKEREESAKEAEILGYSHIGNYMVVHKDDANGGASMYLRSSSLTEDGMIFPIVEGINGSRLASPRTIATLIDDPLFLTKDGVFALITENITRERCVTPRGTRILPRLAKENLSDAVACVHNGYYMLFVGGNVYLADVRQKAYALNMTNEFEYEWYFWDNIPARCVCSNEDVLLFGCEEGNVYRFNTDIRDKAEAYNDNGKPIVAEWTTKMDDFGAFGDLKMLIRRGSGVYVKSYPIISDIEISVRTERDFGTTVVDTYRGIIDFNNIDFTRFTFNTTPYGFVNFDRKIKDFRMAQVTCRNAELNQPFGIYAIELAYKTGYFAK